MAEHHALSLMPAAARAPALSVAAQLLQPRLAAAAAAASSPSCLAAASNSAAAAGATGACTDARAASHGGTGTSGRGSCGGGGNGGAGRGRHRGSWWGSWRGQHGRATRAEKAAAAAAAVSAASLAAAGVVQAEAPPSQALLDALSAARTVLGGSWSEVEEEMERRNAKLPSGAPPLKGNAPTAELVHGALEVVVPIRDGADADAVLKELRDWFRGKGNFRSSSRSWGAGSRTVEMEVSDPARPDSMVRVQLYVPPAGGSEQAQVIVSKRGAYSPEELATLGRLVRAANLTYSAERPAQAAASRRHGFSGGFLSSSSSSVSGPESVDRLFDEMARGLLRGFVAGPLQELMEELQRQAGERGGGAESGGFPFPPHHFPGFPGFPGPGGLQPGGLQPGGGDEDGDEDGEFPARPYRPPGAGSSGSSGGGGHRLGGDGEAAAYDWGSPAAKQAVETLQAMGAQVFPPGSKEKLDWGVLAGYEDQKRTIEDCLLLPLLRPDVYAKLARATRKTFANNRPRAVLFEGPPGTGKTTSARVISSQAAVPLIYLPLEAVLSKWYGQSEQQLGQVFNAAEAMGGAIIFFDELDALGSNRETGNLHEASRRLMSVLLREMEGFDAETKRTVVIGATNRKADLDPALLSRFDLIVTFGLPDAACRHMILKQYAQQLSDPELKQLAERTGGMSGRDLRDVCEHTERRWASKIIRGEVSEEVLPPLPEYLASADERSTAVKKVQEAASAAGALNRLLSGAGGGGGLPSWLPGSRQ